MEVDGLLVAVGTLILALVTALGNAVTAYISSRAKKELEQVNDSVNHRHEKRGNAAPKLYDLLWESNERAHSNHEQVNEVLNELLNWKRSYDGGPLDQGFKVAEFVADVASRLETLEQASQKNNIDHDMIVQKLEAIAGDCQKSICKHEKNKHGLEN